MGREFRRGLVVFALLILGVGFLLSCQEQLSQELEPEKEWKDKMLKNGDQDMAINQPLQVYLGKPIDVDSANLSTVRLYTADLTLVPGGVEFFPPEGENGEPFGIIFRPLCVLAPNTDYKLVIKGVMTSAGKRIPDTIINFRTGDMPDDLKDSFSCSILSLAYGLEDGEGINSGISQDISIMAVIAGVGVPVYPSPLDPFPPNHKMISDPSNCFGVRFCYLDLANYYTNLGYSYWLDSPPYQLLVYINNIDDMNDLDLGAFAEQDRWLNLRPYVPEEMIDQMEGESEWTSSDPVNTPVAVDYSEAKLEGRGCLKVGLNGTDSNGDEASRTWPAGEYAPVTDQTGIQFAAKIGNITSWTTDKFTFSLRLSDEDGDVVETTRDMNRLEPPWIFITRLISDFNVVVDMGGFDKTRISKVSFQISGNDLVGEFYLDFLSTGSLEDLKVYLPDEAIPAADGFDWSAPALPLYVGSDGSSYFARDDGTHIVDLDFDECDWDCPLMSPQEAMTADHLAWPAP